MITAQNFIRTRLATIPGISVPLPYGGKVREVMVDLDPDALYGKGLSATDISNALDLQNLILPTGTVKVGTREYLIRLNSSPELISAMNDIPIKTVNGAPVYMRDIGQVRDGYQVQTNVVRINGGLSVAADRVAAWRRIDAGRGAGRQGSLSRRFRPRCRRR